MVIVGWGAVGDQQALVAAVFYFVFFQAEDGIRDLVRSRGLGDVYKRQTYTTAPWTRHCQMLMQSRTCLKGEARLGIPTVGPVSYTHLTLPTSDLV